MTVLLAVFLTSGAVSFRQYLAYQEGEAAYAAVEELAGLGAEEESSEVPSAEAEKEEAGTEESAEPEEAEKPEKPEVKSTPVPQVSQEDLYNLNLEALREVNRDVEGWILIPGTKISYPLMQAEDNEFYLSRTWDKTWNWLGSIYIECQNDPKLGDFNTIIYGHNLRNSSMFSSLKSYSSKRYWKEHPSVYIAGENGVQRYDIFAAYEVDVEGHAYWLDIDEEETKDYFIKKSIEMSDIDTQITPSASDRIITLSTCTGMGHETRWIVQAVLAEEQATE